jgi:hypothetical protein
VLADLELVKHLYRFDAVEADAPAPEAVVAAGPAMAAAPQNSVATAVVSVSDAPAPSTDDTMEFEPAPAAATGDDTVTLDEQTWTSRIKAGIDTAIAGVAARLARTPEPVAPRQPSTRKR